MVDVQSEHRSASSVNHRMEDLVTRLRVGEVRRLALGAMK